VDDQQDATRAARRSGAGNGQGYRDIIVIGGSAGALDAMLDIAGGFPDDFAGTVFMVSHIGANRSHLPELLSSAGSLPVRHPENGEAIRSGIIYVAPPDQHMMVEGGRIRLSRGPRQHFTRPAVDPLFRTAAAAFGPRIIGVVLSGTGTDGTAGLEKIRLAGGITVIQAPRDALYPEMPQSAASAVEVDHVVERAELPALLRHLSSEKMLPALTDEQTVSTEHFERDLRDTRERLQSTVEEYETALEELKSANEELVSINEELQSTNEELETSREEAQSVNEELNTVNSELQRKVEELNRANDNLRNLFDGTQIATVVLDKELVIRSFTPAMKTIFNLIDIDRGRPLTDIVSGIVDLDLRQEIEPVLASGESCERQVRRRDGKAHYLMRVLPYRTGDRTSDGVLVTFTDITRIIEIEAYQRELRHRIDTMLQLVIVIAQRSVATNGAAGALVDRLQALAKTYDLVSRTPGGDVALAGLARQELGNYGIARDGRVMVEGPPVLLKAQAAVSLGMALRELAANAAKDGALSVPQGRVHLGWSIEQAGTPQARLAIHWRESGGPAVRPPAATGYGSELIETQLKEQIGAAGSISFADGGVTVSLTLPLSTGLVLLPGPEGEETDRE
jgi:two-component sensor histidine kinase